MYKLKLIKKSVATVMLLALAVVSFGISNAEAVAPNWDASGSYVIAFKYLGTDYLHDATLVQDGSGNLTGNGGYPAGAAHTYAWTITSGSVSGDSISFDANYTASADAVNPLTTLHATGTIAGDGSISGTWSDNFQGGSRGGTWMTSSGVAVIIPPPPSSVKVTILKYINGETATSVTANNSSFQMNATWSASNIGAGSGQYALSTVGFNNPNPYQATTSDMSLGANYVTTESMNSTVGPNCEAGKPFALEGYTSGSSLAQAEAGVPSMGAPALTNITSDKFIIVWNIDCAHLPPGNTEGSIDGTVTGGTNPGVLQVTSIDTIKGSGTADGTFANGWKYVFHITVPTDETHLAMKFGNWLINGGGASTIAAANNIRISSSQADNAGATVLITAANTYSSPKLHMTSDLNGALDGLQVNVTVEAAIPAGTVNGSYSTNYGVQTD